MKISVVINTKNEEESIGRCLQSVAWADEIVVVDMQSSDATVEIARRHTDKVFDCEDFGFVEPARNLAISYATGDWILILDADEVPSPQLAEQIRELVASSEGYSLIAIPRRNYLGDYLIRNSGWGRDFQPRLFRKRTVKWSSTIHSWPEVDGEIKYLNPDLDLYIKHFNFADLSDFVEKVNRYTSVEAQQYNTRTAHTGWRDVIRSVVDEFRTRYTPREDGFYSLALAGSMAFYRFLIYCKALERLRPEEMEIGLVLPDTVEEIAIEIAKQLDIQIDKELDNAQHEAHRAQFKTPENQIAEVRTGYESQLNSQSVGWQKDRGAYERRIAELERSLSETRERLIESERSLVVSCGQEAALKDVIAIQQSALAKLREGMESRDRMLGWISLSRAWRAASKLRRWHQSALELRQNLPGGARFTGRIETVARSDDGRLELQGWAASSAGTIILAEVFADDFYLGALTLAPEEGKSQTNFSGSLLIPSCAAGQKHVTVRIFDDRGNSDLLACSKNPSFAVMATAIQELTVAEHKIKLPDTGGENCTDANSHHRDSA